MRVFTKNGKTMKAYVSCGKMKIEFVENGKITSACSVPDREGDIMIAEMTLNGWEEI